jgi:hypothetical protein
MLKLSISGGRSIINAVKKLQKLSVPQTIKQAGKYTYTENTSTFNQAKAPNGRKLKPKKNRAAPIRFARLGLETWQSGFKITAKPQIAFYHQVGATLPRRRRRRELIGPLKRSRLPRRTIIPFKKLPKKWLAGVSSIFERAIK